MWLKPTKVEDGTRVAVYLWLKANQTLVGEMA